MLRKLLLFFLALTLLGVLIGAGAVAYVLLKFGRGLPDYHQLKNYSPPIVTRLYANDGKLLAEYAAERRVFVPYEAIPPLVVKGFLAAEDKNYFNHPGVDAFGVLRAVITNLRAKIGGSNRRPQGASTITQQVAKNFLLSSDTTLERKIKEAILSMRMESVFTKEHILELYLNEIFMGVRAYGIVAAAQEYFNKSLEELTLAEVAFLAALPKGPNNYHPVKRHDAAVARRNWVLKQMYSAGYIGKASMREAQAEPLVMRRRPKTEYVNAPYFAEDVRRQLVETYGYDAVYKGGLTVRTTVDPTLQRQAQKALWQGIINYDRRQGWRGPINTVNDKTVPEKQDNPFKSQGWRVAVVTSVAADKANIKFKNDDTGTIAKTDMRWARKQLKGRKGNYLGPVVTKATQVMNKGDLVYVGSKKVGKKTILTLEQAPEVNGGFVAIDVHTGRVKAMVGGFSFPLSEFNRASQANRQPGSTFKPFAYLAALEKNYTPANRVLDAPIVISQGPGKPAWKPQNYSKNFLGPTTLRRGIELSRNVMTVRIARSIGIKSIQDIARRFEIDPNMRGYYSAVLGANETTALKLTNAYAMLANGGRHIKPVLIDRIQDRDGNTLYRSDQRQCNGCETAWNNSPPPSLTIKTTTVTDPASAYQMVSMLEGVVQRGTGKSISAIIKKPLAGKTGTTNDSRDAWFAGFSPDIAAGVYVGHDQPKTLGEKETGGRVAAPIFRDFMKEALKDKPAKPFPIPPEIKLVRVSLRTGQRASGPGTIMEAFKQGQNPPAGWTSFSEDTNGAYDPNSFGGFSMPNTPSTGSIERSSTLGGNTSGGRRTKPAQPAKPIESIPTFSFEGGSGVY